MSMLHCEHLGIHDTDLRICEECNPEPADDMLFNEQAMEALQEAGLTEDEAEAMIDDFLA